MKQHSLFEEDRTKARVESTDALVLKDLAESTHQTGSKVGLGDKPDTSGLKRAESNVGDEFGSSGRSEVDGSSVVGGGLDTKHVDALFLEQFVATELEGTLQEVSGGRGAKAGQESAGAFVLDELAESANHASVVGLRVELDLRLDTAQKKKHNSQSGLGIDNGQRYSLLFRVQNLHIDRRHGAVGNSATDSTSKGESGIKAEGAHLRLGCRGRSRLSLGRTGSHLQKSHKQALDTEEWREESEKRQKLGQTN